MDNNLLLKSRYIITDTGVEIMDWDVDIITDTITDITTGTITDTITDITTGTITDIVMLLIPLVSDNQET